MKIQYRIERPIRLEVSCALHPVTALVGASGVGKTTLLRALAGLISADGTPWAGLPPQRRPVAYLPQGAAVFPHLRVWQNVAYALPGSRSERYHRALELLEAVGLRSLAERSGRQLSGGQARRVALARSVARSPELLLLDEPTAGLDPHRRAQVLDLLFRITGENGPRMLAATHDPGLAMRSGRVLVLENGRIVQSAAPDAVYLRPATLGAAQALGLSNLLSVTILGREETPGHTWAFVDAGSGLCLRAPWPSWGNVGSQAVLLVHPENLSLKKGTDDCVTKGIVERRSRDGGGWRVTCRVGPMSIGVFQYRNSDSAPPEPGDEVGLDINCAELHLLRPDGENLMADSPAPVSER